jgi:dihydroceramide fatty acyl 2-hydroxylase
MLRLIVMLLLLLMFGLGCLTWTFVEYLIHGFLSHILTTFATPFHAGHHRDPHSVFTAGAWGPTAIVSAMIFGIVGLTPLTTLWLGMVVGFLAYELLHYRIHFAHPVCAFEERMRARHLAHHLRASDQIFGVTNAIWDRVFGTEPDTARLLELRASVAAVEPLTGPTNFRFVFRPWVYLTR